MYLCKSRGLDIKKVYVILVYMNELKEKKLDTRRSVLLEADLHHDMMSYAKEQNTSLVGLIRDLFNKYGRNIQS
jgi:hypothetical protein